MWDAGFCFLPGVFSDRVGWSNNVFLKIRSVRSFLFFRQFWKGLNWKILSFSESIRRPWGASPCFRMIFPSVVFSASLPSFFFSPPFFVSFISLLSAYPVEKMCLFPSVGIFSCFPDCLHFNPVRIFSSSLHLFFLPASTLFLPGTPFFRFFPSAFPLPFPCAYI